MGRAPSSQEERVIILLLLKDCTLRAGVPQIFSPQNRQSTVSRFLLHSPDDNYFLQNRSENVFMGLDDCVFRIEIFSTPLTLLFPLQVSLSTATPRLPSSFSSSYFFFFLEGVFFPSSSSSSSSYLSTSFLPFSSSSYFMTPCSNLLTCLFNLKDDWVKFYFLSPRYSLLLKLPSQIIFFSYKGWRSEEEELLCVCVCTSSILFCI